MRGRSFVAYTWSLSLSGLLLVPLGPLGAVSIPGYMVWAALLYASLGTWLALRIGAPLVRLRATGAASRSGAHRPPDCTSTASTSICPTGLRCCRALSFTVLPGRSLLIVGPAGSGKTTLLRAIAGIWPYGKGRIEIPDTARAVIMPETPYLPRDVAPGPQVDARIADDDLQWDPRQIGTAQRDGLAERDGAAAYSRAPIGPEGSGFPTDADLERALALCGVAHLASRFDDEQDWAQRLSLNEQKRLAFARLLLHRPNLIFLDETTSDLDDESALNLYRILRAELPGAMVITVGHIGPLQQLHDAQLELRRCGERA